jgi:hypothetical protein
MNLYTTPTVNDFVELMQKYPGAYLNLKGRFGLPTEWNVPLGKLFKALFVVANLPTDKIVGVMAIGSMVGRRWVWKDSDLGPYDLKRKKQYLVPRDFDFLVLSEAPLDTCVLAGKFDVCVLPGECPITFASEEKVHLTGFTKGDIGKWYNEMRYFGWFLFGDFEASGKMVGYPCLRPAEWRKPWLRSPVCTVRVRERGEPEKELGDRKVAGEI